MRVPKLVYSMPISGGSVPRSAAMSLPERTLGFPGGRRCR
jgi:hypothetical protein